MKVCLVSNELLLVYSIKFPVYNNVAGNQYSSTYNGPRKKFQQNFTSNDSKKRNFQQKSKNHHTEKGNCSENCVEPRQNGEQSSIKSKVPEHEEPLNNEKVNGHSEHGSDDTNDKGGTKRETTISKANVEHPGNEDDLKNSDNSDQISQKSHTSNGELL
jgi:L-lactate utilization protein LutB